MPPSGGSKWAVLAKIGMTCAAVTVLVKHADWQEIGSHVGQMHKGYLLAAILVLFTGQVISALRMRYYFAVEKLDVSRQFSVALYFIGALFSLFLPGGISGDGYKAYYVKRYLKFPLTTGIRLMLSNRANGLLMLFVLTFVMGFLSPEISSMPYAVPLMTLGIIGVFPCYYIAARYLLQEKLSTQLHAARYSIVLQIFCLLTAFLLLLSFSEGGGVSGYDGHMLDYLVLFMISNLVMVLPISVGGIGVRELTFFYGSQLLGLDRELGVALCIMYFGIHVFITTSGIPYYFRINKMRAEPYAGA